MTLLSGFQVLLSRLSGSNEIVIGIPSAAQSLLEGETLVGHCVNFLPIRAELDRQAPFSKIQKICKATILDAYKNQKYTFGTLVRKLRIPRDPSRLPLIEVQFNLERVGQKAQFVGLQVEVDSCPKKFVNFDLFLNIVESPKGLVLDCDYNRALFDGSTINRWLGCYETLLTSAAANSGQAIGALAMIESRDLQALLDLNPQPSSYPVDCCIHDLIADRVLHDAPEIAITYKGQNVTYGQLNDLSEKLAAFLLKNGIGRDKPVAILSERSVEMVVSMLAILKAGGAYLPLDPSHPKSRPGLNFGRGKPGANP